ncbi:MAG: MATE family efflux transporter [Lachnospiraceae bacterium]|nr:MATE family efflux transporter [Lachnospiraceae bacterium]
MDFVKKYVVKNNKNTNRELLLHGNMLQAILTLAIPVVINSFLQTMYNLTDTYWLGKLGTEELAAINLVSPMQNIIINFGSGITVAGSVLISQYLGAKRDDDARSMANQIFACALIFSVVCAGLGALFTPSIVTWLGAEGETWQHSKTYMQLVILDMPFLFTVNMYTAINQAQGDTLRPMLLNFTGIVLNMILDPLFMVWLSMGVAGAALATVSAKAVPAVIAFILLQNRDKDVYLRLSKLKFEKEKLKNILVVGLPTAIGGSTMQFGFLLMSRNVFKYGTQAMAAYGIGNKINSLITLPTNGIGSAVATIVGQNVGAKQYDRAEQGYKMSRRISVIFLFVGGMILSRMPVSTAIVQIFSDDAEVISMAADFLSIMAFWCFANGVHNSSMGLFQGSGHTEVTMMIDAARLWIFRFATLFVCETWLNMGVRSVWYSVVVSNGLSALVLFIIYKTGYWRKKRI